MQHISEDLLDLYALKKLPEAEAAALESAGPAKPSSDYRIPDEIGNGRRGLVYRPNAGGVPAESK